MDLIKVFLDSAVYREFVEKFKTLIPVRAEIYDTEIYRLIERLKQRQFLLEGFNCKLYSEDELVKWYIKLIQENKEEIFDWIEAFNNYHKITKEEYPDGEFPKGEELAEDEKSKILTIKKTVKSCFALYIIEFEILKNNPKILEDYYKRIKIPGSTKYAREMKKLYDKTF